MNLSLHLPIPRQLGVRDLGSSIPRKVDGDHLVAEGGKSPQRVHGVHPGLGGEGCPVQEQDGQSRPGDTGGRGGRLTERSQTVSQNV